MRGREEGREGGRGGRREGEWGEEEEREQCCLASSTICRSIRTVGQGNKKNIYYLKVSNIVSNKVSHYI